MAPTFLQTVAIRLGAERVERKMTTLTIRVTPSPEVSREAADLQKKFSAVLDKVAAGVEVISPADFILVFLNIINPARGKTADTCIYKRGENAVMVTVNIDYAEFVSSDPRERIVLFAKAIVAALLRIDSARLHDAGRAVFLSQLEEVRAILLSR